MRSKEAYVCFSSTVSLPRPTNPSKGRIYFIFIRYEAVRLEGVLFLSPRLFNRIHGLFLMRSRVSFENPEEMPKNWKLKY